MHSLAAKAYGESTRRTAGPRQLEHALFLQVTEGLDAAARAPANDAGRRTDAVHRNLELWTALAADLHAPGNGLPGELKSSLLYLAEFSRRTSQDVLGGGEGLRDLIEINRIVMEGLQDRAPGADVA